MSKPQLHIFAISHYCEKARWALDYLGIDYELRYVPPGLHMLTAKRLGVRRSSLPILVVGDQVIQGSGEIIDWAEQVIPRDDRSLTPAGQHQACVEIEKRLDKVAGVHTRRYYYSEALVEYPETVRPIFTKDLTAPNRLLVRCTWGAVRRLMIKGMDLGRDQGQASRTRVVGELDWLDGLLEDGRQFLVGEVFSRADMTAASLFSPLAMPDEHPTYVGLQLPPRVSADLEEWRDRPSMRWVREIYARYR